MRKISIFGSTGSVGKKMFDAAIGNFEIICLTAGNNYEELVRQALIARPLYVSINSEFCDIVKSKLAGFNIEILPNEELNNLAQLNVDIVGMALSGMHGLLPSFACLGHTQTLALANKETVVCGGSLFMITAKKMNTKIIPVDSEHNAIYQCLQNRDIQHVNKLVLTCSGGPFIDYSREDLLNVSVKDALKHPNWKMGAKITIDSATLINKALELIEASFLFDFPIEKCKAIIHRESIIHGLVQFNDSSMMALMSAPDMRIPINYAFSYPDSYEFSNQVELNSLSFKPFSDWQKENVNLAYEAYNEKKCITFNIANEMAVQKFIDGALKFSDIPTFIMGKLEHAPHENVSSVSDIVAICNEAKLS